MKALWVARTMAAWNSRSASVAVPALADAAVYVLPPGQDLRHLLRRSPAAGQPGGGGLKDLPQLEEIPQLPPDLV